MNIENVVSVEDRQRAWETWQSFLAGGSVSGEFTQVRKDGSKCVVDYRAVANILPGLHLSVNRDITESKKLQAERDRLMERLRNQIDFLPLAHIQLDSRGRVLEWNPAAANMFGYTKEEAARSRMPQADRPSADHPEGTGDCRSDLARSKVRPEYQ